MEPERAADGSIETTATIFLTGRECPWSCTMCDLWQYTTVEDTPRGAIPAQIADALATVAAELRPLSRVAAGLRSLGGVAAGLRPAVLKLYNAGSFFDRRAVPVEDDEAIADLVAPFARVVVESHPALVRDRVWRFREHLVGRSPATRLEVAMGLETAHPHALAALNKGITPQTFARAAAALKAHDVDLRVFLLIDPPFVPPEEQDEWLMRSLSFAADCGATCVSLIPTRLGNPSLDALAAVGRFAPPSMQRIESAAATAVAARLERTLRSDPGSRLPVPGCRLFIDLWNLERFSACRHCFDARRARLVRFNLEQQLPPAVACDVCGEEMHP